MIRIIVATDLGHGWNKWNMGHLGTLGEGPGGWELSEERLRQQLFTN